MSLLNVLGIRVESLGDSEFSLRFLLVKPLCEEDEEDDEYCIL